MLSAPWIPACDVSVSPDPPQPGPMSTVGRAGPFANRLGNQWIRMIVPSNDVRSKSDGTPDTATALVDCQSPGGWQPSAAAAGDPRSQWIGALSDAPASPATIRARARAATIPATERRLDPRAKPYLGLPAPIVPVTASPPRRGPSRCQIERSHATSPVTDQRLGDHDPNPHGRAADHPTVPPKALSVRRIPHRRARPGLEFQACERATAVTNCWPQCGRVSRSEATGSEPSRGCRVALTQESNAGRTSLANRSRSPTSLEPNRSVTLSTPASSRSRKSEINWSAVPLNRGRSSPSTQASGA